MKRLFLSAARGVVFVAIGSLMACGGGSTTAPTPPATPTNPTPPTPPNANVFGSYDLTLTASSTCSQNLPSATRVLKYVATISQVGTGVHFEMKLSGDVAFETVSIGGGVSGQKVIFGLFTLIEKTTGGGISLTAVGEGTAAADGSITGTLNGTYQTPSGATCNAANHHIQMVKR